MAQAVTKTSIYINQLSIYSSLAPCAENRLSVTLSYILYQPNKFARYMSSVISTAVQKYCAINGTAEATVTTTTDEGYEVSITAQASRTTRAPEVEAINVFNSYCERSTELYLCVSSFCLGVFSVSNIYVDQGKSASTITTASLSTLIITATPSFTSSASTETTSTTPSQNKPAVPLAVIIAPAVVGVLVVAGIIVALIFWRRKKGVHQSPTETPNEGLEHNTTVKSLEQSSNQEEGVEGRQEVATPAYEASGDSIRYELTEQSTLAEVGDMR
ncbi:hypothetical protein HYFRA_00005504 [Hymenoscyphus fraxineus]|uniref:Mid2 domain-containing protein n=1 Tax=Hymenoscyphus fraxineus TaxID=746836 RepID=A0A9N9KPW5_9HELO|nr:hypothetical protein HYFRA_00005504 [Hymenoscyphus fraxineus]